MINSEVSDSPLSLPITISCWFWSCWSSHLSRLWVGCIRERSERISFFHFLFLYCLFTLLIFLPLLRITESPEGSFLLSVIQVGRECLRDVESSTEKKVPCGYSQCL